MRKMFLVFPILWVFAFAALLLGLSGCDNRSAKPSSKRGSQTAVPRGLGDSLFRLVNETKPSIILKRQNGEYELKAERGFRFFSDDALQNKSPEDIQLQGIQDEFRFLLRPKANVQLAANSLVLIEGAMRLEFRKVKGIFKVKIPGATLGIRGTKLDVTVNSDKTAVVQMIEGSVEVDRNGTITIIKDNDIAVLYANGATVVNPTGSEIPDFLKNLSPDKMRDAIQKF